MNNSSLFLSAPHLVSDARAFAERKASEISEYKAFYVIQTYFPLFHQALQQENTQVYTKILFRLLHLLKKNGRTSHSIEIFAHSFLFNRRGKVGSLITLGCFLYQLMTDESIII
jgi:hypothetical protein